jgi:hypothetical protein
LQAEFLYIFPAAHAEKILGQQMNKQQTKTMASALNKIIRAILKLSIGEPHDAKMMLSTMSKVGIGW